MQGREHKNAPCPKRSKKIQNSKKKRTNNAVQLNFFVTGHAGQMCLKEPKKKRRDWDWINRTGVMYFLGWAQGNGTSAMVGSFMASRTIQIRAD